MDLILVGLGGACGSLVRYTLGRAVLERSKSKLPVGTFVINVSGAFLLGLVSGLELDKNVYFLLAEGFLGAYTTFSTFMFEGFRLFTNRRKLNAAAYITGSLFFGVIFYALGFGLGDLFKS